MPISPPRGSKSRPSLARLTLGLTCAAILTSGCAGSAATAATAATAAAGGRAPATTVVRTGEAPGRVVKVERLPQEFRLPNAGKAQRITYWSTGSDGRPVMTAGRAFLPRGRAPHGGWPVVSWHHGTVGLAAGCAPSVAGGGESEAAFLDTWLSQGYAVVAADYAGMGDPPVQPELDGRTEAHWTTT